MAKIEGNHLKVGDIISFPMNGSPRGKVTHITDTHILIKWDNGVYTSYHISREWEIIDDGE